MSMKIYLLHYTQAPCNWSVIHEWLTVGRPTIWPVTSTPSKPLVRSMCHEIFTASSATSLIILSEGEVVLEVWNGSGYQLVGWKGCLHVQGLSRNFFSVPAVMAMGDNMSITKNGCALTIKPENRRWDKGRKSTPLENARWIVAMNQRWPSTSPNGTLKHNPEGRLWSMQYCEARKEKFPKEEFLTPILQWIGLLRRNGALWSTIEQWNTYIAMFILKNVKYAEVYPIRNSCSDHQAKR